MTAGNGRSPRSGGSARWRGAVAGFVPTLAIALLFALGGTTASPGEVAVSLALVAAIATAAGWLAGPLVAAERRILVAAFGYAIALIAMTGLLSIAQGVSDAFGANGLDPVAILTAAIGRAAYALVGTAYLILPAIVLGLAWSLAARGLMRLGGSRHDAGDPAGHGSTTAGDAPPNRRPARDPRRLGLGAAGIIAGYALVVGAISAGAIGLQGSTEFEPPHAVPRPIFLAILLMLPALVAGIGAVRRSRPVLIAAGVLCLGQSLIAFSGVTIPFVVPAYLLLAIGGQGLGIETSRRAVAGGVFVVLLGIAAWVAPFAMTETICWLARTGADGAVVYTRIPVTDTFTLDSGDLASGCDGGDLTVQGVGLAAVLGIGAVAIAALASTRSSTSETAPERID